MTDGCGRGLGVVVVGVGIAGRVRIRDISQSAGEEDSRWQLIGYISRRDVEIDGASQITEDEALSRPDVDAAIVCTEPGTHDSIIRKFLQHGKHVLVEFPTATSLTCTRELYSLAAEKDLVLHEENIALLSQSFKDMKERVDTVTSPIVKVDLNLIGSYNGWVEDMVKSGGPFCVGISMVQSLYHLFGADLAATGGQLVVDNEGFTASAKLTTAKCSDLNLKVTRTKEKSRRQKTLRIELADGSIIEDSPEKHPPPSNCPVPKAKKPGLFMQDFLMFVREVYKERDYKDDIDKVLHCMAVAEQIHRYMGLKPSVDTAS